MLKTMLLIGAAAISFPALAQDQPADPTAPPAQTDSAPPASQPSEPATEATQPAPAPEAAQPAPAPDASTPPAAEPAPPAGEATTAQSAPSGSAATPAQVAQIVDKEFPTYDADSSAELSEVEFAGWMKKLRAASEPTVDVESAEVQTWIGQAWGAADADKNGTVSKEELTAFLSRGA